MIHHVHTCTQSLRHVQVSDCSLPDFSIHAISQARKLEWVAVSFSRGSLDPGIEPASSASSALADGFFTTESPRSQLDTLIS